MRDEVDHGLGRAPHRLRSTSATNPGGDYNDVQDVSSTPNLSQHLPHLAPFSPLNSSDISASQNEARRCSMSASTSLAPYKKNPRDPRERVCCHRKRLQFNRKPNSATHVFQPDHCWYRSDIPGLASEWIGRRFPSVIKERANAGSLCERWGRATW